MLLVSYTQRAILKKKKFSKNLNCAGNCLKTHKTKYFRNIGKFNFFQICALFGQYSVYFDILKILKKFRIVFTIHKTCSLPDQVTALPGLGLSRSLPYPFSASAILSLTWPLQRRLARDVVIQRPDRQETRDRVHQRRYGSDRQTEIGWGEI